MGKPRVCGWKKRVCLLFVKIMLNVCSFFSSLDGQFVNDDEGYDEHLLGDC